MLPLTRASGAGFRFGLALGCIIIHPLRGENSGLARQDSPARRWRQDALRHTFASYHLSHFRSYAELQLEIGHRDAALLRTRHVDMRGEMAPSRFWAA